jgi:hypothetical protein
MKLEISPQIFKKKAEIMKIRPVGVKLFHTDGHDEAVTFHNFANAPENENIFCHSKVFTSAVK